MIQAFLAGVLLIAASGADAMDAQTFLDKAEALQKRGPMALFSSDYKRLKGAAEAAGAELKAERTDQLKSGRPPAYCPPEKASFGSSELLSGLRAIPAAERPRTSLKAAMRILFVRKWPCRG